MPVSKRAAGWISSTYGLMEGMELASRDPFDAHSNPTGCINLGAAENPLMFDMLKAKVGGSQMTALQKSDIRYNDFTGIKELKSAASSFLNHHLRVPEELSIRPSSVTFHNGCGSAVESLFHVLCDCGDGILVPSPYYGGFDFDVERRSGVHVIPVPLESTDYRVTLAGLNNALASATCPVRALLIMNPVNPLGTIISENDIDMMANFCLENQLEFVVDEIYALSVFDKSKEFQSILATKWSLTAHFIWGFSKDFCVNGFRAGLVVSKDPEVIRGLNELSYFTGISTLMQRLFTEMLEDIKWNTEFFEKNCSRLRSAYSHVVKRLFEFNSKSPLKIGHLEASAGFFIWLDFSEFLGASGDLKSKERQMYLDFISKGKIYIAPGSMAFHSARPGTFRMIFAETEEVLDLAMDRIFSVLQSFK
eukprot:Partr_v1_DN25242_c0_g1_i1_m16888 putative 1-aminocyclopropane-1-carboxylate synthase